MSEFVDLSTSFYDPAFTLDPYTTLKPYYDDPDVMGFVSEGMRFCFRFDDGCTLIRANDQVGRQPVDADGDSSIREAFRQRYPTRAWGYQNTNNMASKVVLVKHLKTLARNIRFDGAESLFEGLSEHGMHEDYFDKLQLLPMRVLLNAWGIEFSEEDLSNLYDQSVTVVKSFDNFAEEALIDAGEIAMAKNLAFLREQVKYAAPGTLLYSFIEDSKKSGIDDDPACANLLRFIQSTPNTLSISTALMLRNILRYPNAMAPIRKYPEQIDDNVILEFLRRDNHVKALSRQVLQPLQLADQEFTRGDSLYIFFPGMNLDPGHWHDPLALDFTRDFSRGNQHIFGGSRRACIGVHLSMTYFRQLLPAMLAALEPTAELDDSNVEVDGHWVVERVITRMPIYNH